MRHHLVLRVVAKLLIPLIMLFALYVQFHGDYGPGGGFQAGVIFGSAFILYALIFGLDNAQKVVPSGYLMFLVSAGLLLYAGVGYAAMFKGGNFLDYGVLAGDFIAGQHLGILLVELGVGITVGAVMIVIFFAFAGRGNGDDQDDEVTASPNSSGEA
jgi:multicomponent Na+:H+ antiporter subunit B